ncbi:MAG: type II secretion system protein [Elusimicrobiota bacterium]
MARAKSWPWPPAPRRDGAAGGFTLVEVLVVCVILAFLLGVAVQQFMFLRRRAQESAMRGNLGALRAGLLIYYSDNDGVYPASLFAMTPRYVQEIPFGEIPPVEGDANPGHRSFVSAEQVYPSAPASPADFLSEGSALWGYVGDPRSGRVFVNCRHLDTKLSPWTRW